MDSETKKKWIQVAVGVVVCLVVLRVMQRLLLGEDLVAYATGTPPDGSVGALPAWLGGILNVVVAILMGIGAATIWGGKTLLAWLNSMVNGQPATQVSSGGPLIDTSTMSADELLDQAMNPPPEPMPAEQLALLRMAMDRAIHEGNLTVMERVAEQLSGRKPVRSAPAGGAPAA